MTDASTFVDSAAAVPSAEVAEAHAREAGLRYVSDAEPGIRRIRQGKSFRYTGPDGRPVRDAETLARIRRLAIPPAYESVWICINARGHLQANGRDARGRKQYRYHPEWHSTRDDSKFDRMLAFADALPKLRRQLRCDLALPGLPREKVLATVVAILDATRVRIGNAEYARDNNSYGLATLKDRHASFARGRALLRFRGKSGIEHELELDDRRLSGIVRRCQQLPGQQLFQYLDDNGGRRAVDSGQVNDYLRAAMSGDFTAKDFRTWGATLRAIALMAATPLPERGGDRASKACVNAAIAIVAAELRNTPAVCRKSYVNPLVFEGWRAGTLHQDVTRTAARGLEKLAIKFLRREQKRSAQRQDVGKQLAASLRKTSGRKATHN